MDCCGQLAGYFSVIKVVGMVGNLFQRLGQFGLAKNLARFVVVPVTLENPPRVGKSCQIFIVQIVGILPSQREAIASQFDSRSHHALNG